MKILAPEKQEKIMRKTLLTFLTLAFIKAGVHFGVDDATFEDANGAVTFSVMYSTDAPIAGFQFDIINDGIITFDTQSIVTGGNLSGFSLSGNAAGVVLGFSMTGAEFDGEGLLFTISGTYNTENDGQNIVLRAEENEVNNTRLIASASGGAPMDVTFWPRNWTIGQGALDVNASQVNTYSLSDNFPNPFNPSTNINFSIESYGEASLLIYDALGREVKSLISGTYVPGQYTATWNGTDNNGNEMSSGMYFYKFTSGSFTQTKKMLFVK